MSDALECQPNYLIIKPVMTATTRETTDITSAQLVLLSRPLILKPFADLRR